MITQKYRETFTILIKGFNNENDLFFCVAIFNNLIPEYNEVK